MSAATATNTASRAGRESALSDPGFRPAVKGEEVAAIAAHPDAKLLALSEQWLAVEARHRAMNDQMVAAQERGDTAEDDRLFQAMCADVPEKNALRDAIFQATPATPEGLRAQAQVILAFYDADEPANGDERMICNFAKGAVRLLPEKSASAADVALLAACAEHVRLAAEEARLLGVMRSFDVDDNGAEAQAAEDAWDAAGDVTHGILENIVDDVATTIGGVAAKGRAVLIYWRTLGLPTPENINFEERGALSVLADLERMANGAEPPASDADADLIRWCARWPQTEDEYGAASEPYVQTVEVIFPPEVEATLHTLADEGNGLLERIGSAPAHTLKGMKAKARVALRLAADRGEEAGEAIAWGILRDLLEGDPFLTIHERIMASRKEMQALSRTHSPGEAEYRDRNGAKRAAEADRAELARTTA